MHPFYSGMWRKKVTKQPPIPDSMKGVLSINRRDRSSSSCQSLEASASPPRERRDTQRSCLRKLPLITKRERIKRYLHTIAGKKGETTALFWENYWKKREKRQLILRKMLEKKGETRAYFRILPAKREKQELIWENYWKKGRNKSLFEKITGKKGRNKSLFFETFWQKKLQVTCPRKVE